MNNLTQEQKDLVIDYFFECGTDEQITSGRILIENDSGAKELYGKLKTSLGPLDYIAYDPCPDDLAEITLNKLKLAASAENTRLTTLLEEESNKKTEIPATVNHGLWHNLVEVAAIAAVILVVASISMPVFSHMRKQAWQVACNTGLARIGQGISRYMNDNDFEMPAVATAAGSPWWKVGDQGEKNQSNTRHPWVLVKNGYVEGKDFTCAGRRDAADANYTQDQLKQLQDFPSRKHISYSYMYMCPDRAKRSWNGRMVIMADRNPIFERIPTDHAAGQFRQFSIGDELRRVMSQNHGNGQTLLFYDGSATYMKVRVIDGDDIYTARNKTEYTGCETPDGMQDIFLIP